MKPCGIIIATHGDFGKAMLESLQRMLGPQEAVTAIALHEGMGREDLADQMDAARARLGPSLLLVDMLGGTPWNAALMRGLKSEDEVLSGLSLPMLVEAFGQRESKNPRELGLILRSTCSNTLALASVMLGKAGA